MPLQPHVPFVVLLVPWLLFGIAGSVFFVQSPDGALKRRMWPGFVIAVYLLFVLVLRSREAPTPGWFYAVLGAALVLNLTTVRFCDACGAMVMRGPRGASATTCPRCGASMNGRR